MENILPKLTPQECYERCENDCKESYARVGAKYEEYACSNKGKTYVNTCLLWCDRSCKDREVEEVYKGHCKDFYKLIEILDQESRLKI